MLNPNMVMEIQISQKFWKKWENFGISSALEICMERIKTFYIKHPDMPLAEADNFLKIELSPVPCPECWYLPIKTTKQLELGF